MQANKQQTNNQNTNTLVIIASFVVIMAGIKMSQTIVVPFLLAIFIAVVCSPILDFLEKKGFPEFLALITVILLVIGILTGAGFIAAEAINSFITKMPELQTKLTIQLNSILNEVSILGLDLGKHKSQILESFSSSEIFSTLGSFLKSLSKIVSKSFLIFLMVLFILFERRVFQDKLNYLGKIKPSNKTMIIAFLNNFKKYLAIKTLTSLATGIAIAFILYMMDVGYAVLWGFLAFLLNYIPTIGSIVAAIPAIIITILEINFTTALWVALVFLIVNIAFGNIIEPRFMGKGLGISTIVVLLSLLFWGMILGTVGMFLAIPLTMGVKIALSINPRTKWLAIMLSGKTTK